MLGNRTRLGRGKRGISIKSYEEFFVLPCLIHGTAVSSEKECSKAAAESFCHRSNLADGAHDGILHDFCRLIDAVDHLLGYAIETGNLNVQRVACIAHHRFNAS